MSRIVRALCHFYKLKPPFDPAYDCRFKEECPFRDEPFCNEFCRKRIMGLKDAGT